MTNSTVNAGMKPRRKLARNALTARYGPRRSRNLSWAENSTLNVDPDAPAAFLQQAPLARPAGPGARKGRRMAP
eukprot:843770-Pyramimonas_sp.AAC.1